MKSYRHSEKDEAFREPDMAGRYTARDYLNWQFEELVELIRGRIYKMTPSPTNYHQLILGELYAQLRQGALPTSNCRIWLGPLDVFLIQPGEDWRDTENIVEPDLFINCDSSRVERRGCMGAPEFVVEILSPSTRRKDQTHKLSLYEEYGVREYWMISAVERQIVINLLNDKGQFEKQPLAREGDRISPRDFPHLQVDLKVLFADLGEVGSHG